MNSIERKRSQPDPFMASCEGDTPVPFPNTEVKTLCADDTAWATGWETRSTPYYFLQKPASFEAGFCALKYGRNRPYLRAPQCAIIEQRADLCGENRYEKIFKQ